MVSQLLFSGGGVSTQASTLQQSQQLIIQLKQRVKGSDEAVKSLEKEVESLKQERAFLLEREVKVSHDFEIQLNTEKERANAI